MDALGAFNSSYSRPTSMYHNYKVCVDLPFSSFIHLSDPFAPTRVVPRHVLTFIFAQRSHSTMSNADMNRSSSPDSLFITHPSEEHHGDSQRRRLNSALALPTRRPSHFVGDGYDYRRPIMSAGGGAGAAANRGPAAVIDLTHEDGTRGQDRQATSTHDTEAVAGSSRAQRLPRFARNIMDNAGEEDVGEHSTARTSTVSSILGGYRALAHTDRHPHYSGLRQPHRQQSSYADMDELFLIGERPRSRRNTASRESTAHALPAPRSVTPYPTGLNDPIDLTGEDDEVVHLESRTLPRTNLVEPTATAGVGTRGLLEPLLAGFEAGGRLFNRFAGGARTTTAALDDYHHHRPRNPVIPADDYPQITARHQMAAIHLMDYGTVAFDMGLEGGNQPAQPKYQAPPAAKSGFTRSPGEDEIVVCPNCGDELAMGNSEEKQTVWVMKKCGHVCLRLSNFLRQRLLTNL